MAIFLLIAGTYTPFTLGALRGAVGLDAFCRSLELGYSGDRIHFYFYFLIFLEVLGFAVFPCACTSA